MSNPDHNLRDVPSIEDQRRFWNAWNARNREVGGIDPVSQRRAEKILEILGSLNLSKPEIIEIGCGSGWLSEQLIAFGPVTGVDLADEVIARARERNSGATFLAGDFLTMDLGATRYDVAISVSTLSHVADQNAFVNRAADLLKPGGYLILATQNRMILSRSETVRQTEPGQIRKWLGIGEVKKLVNSRFVVLRVTTIVPSGHMGFLQIVNSYRLSDISENILGRHRVRTLKERLGLGQTIIVLAKRR